MRSRRSTTGRRCAGRARSNPAAAQRQLRGWRDRVKVPLYVQGGIGNEFEGVDANIRTIERLATTPYGTDPEVDAILDGAGRHLQRDPEPGRPRRRGAPEQQRLTSTATSSRSRSRRRRRRSGSCMSGSRRRRLDLPGPAITPTLIEATTKPHNPGIDYDLWLKLEPAAHRRERGGAERGQPRRHAPDQRLVRGREPAPAGGICPGGGPPEPAVAEGWDDWGPFYTPMYSQLVGLNGSTVEMCQARRPHRRGNRCYLDTDPDPAKNPIGWRGAPGATRDDLVDSWSTKHGQPERAPERPARDLSA